MFDFVYVIIRSVSTTVAPLTVTVTSVPLTVSVRVPDVPVIMEQFLHVVDTSVIQFLDFVRVLPVAVRYGGSRYVNGAEPYKTMQTLWYHYQPKRVPLQVSLLAMNVGTQSQFDDDDGTKNQQLLGTYVKANPGKFNLEGSFYYQLGKNEFDVPIYAWMTAVRGGYQFDNRWSVYGGYDYLSGDEHYNVPPAGGVGLQRLTEINGFNLLFGSHHQFYGAMDFFYLTTYYGGLTPGLQNLYVGGKWSPNQKVSLETSYHYMATAVKVLNADKPLGHQVEFTASYAPLRDDGRAHEIRFPLAER